MIHGLLMVLQHVFRNSKIPVDNFMRQVFSLKKKKKRRPRRQKKKTKTKTIVAENDANHEKVEYYFKIPHFQSSQATFSFLGEKQVIQQKLLTVTLVNLSKLLTVTLVNLDSYSPFKKVNRWKL